MSFNKQRGDAGEEIAARYLSDNGFEILERNWRTGHYELDIVARRYDTLHFVEVKCRREDSLTPPEMGMTKAKQRSLMRAVAGYLALHENPLEIQIDLIAVEMSCNDDYRVRYIPNAVIARW